MIDNFYSKLETWMKSDDYKYHYDLDKKKRIELNKFIAHYNLEHLKKMKIEEYVTGMNNKNSFCNMVENVFKNYGMISGRTTAFQKFVIYWSADDNDYLFGDKRTKNRKGFGSSKEEIYNNVRNCIVKVVEASLNNDYKTIAMSPLNPQFKNKIAFLYNYDNQMPVYSNDDLNVILTIFGIPFDKNEDRAFKREKLFKFYKDNEIDKILSTDMFMSFIYGWYGYRSFLRTDEKPVLNKKEISKYNLIDIKIDKVNEYKHNENKKRVIYNPESEEKKRINGRKAEDIVLEYLEDHKDDLNIKTICSWCTGVNQDDGKGYDISYIDNDNVEYFIEVKSSGSDLKDIVTFEMSLNEYNVMKANPNTYYVYFVNNVNEGKVIQRILGKDLYGEMPVKYRLSFHAKNV